MQRQRDQGHGDLSCTRDMVDKSDRSVSFSKGGQRALYPLLYPHPLLQATSLPPSLGRGCHLGGVTFQGSEVEFRTILSSWYELCFLPRQNWQSMGKFYFER